MPRWITRWGIAILALISIGGYLLLLPPLPIPPEIGRGLPGNFAEADDEFERRVSAEFTLPMAETELMARLSKQGFTIHSDNHYAAFEKVRFPCTLVWRVHWETVDGRMGNLTSKYGGVCL